MSDRERSRSPDRGDPPKEEANEAPPAPAPAPINGDDKPPAAPQDSNGDSAPANNSGDAGSGGDQVKLYVGNLDYGK